MNKDIEAYKTATAWVQNIHPGASTEYVHINLTWPEWNALRALYDLAPQQHGKPKGMGGSSNA